MKAVIATSTFYNSIEDVRFKMAIKFVREAAKLGYPVFVVDASPSTLIKNLLESQGAVVWTAKDKRMGPARRQVIREAALGAGKKGVVIWAEPEKYTFIPLIRGATDRLTQENADLLIPRRKSLESYPSIQQLTEPVANQAFSLMTGRDLDIFFGPQIFRTSVADFYLDYDGVYGDEWDCLQIPVMRMISSSRKVIEMTVAYRHPEEQKQENDLVMIEKRARQLCGILKLKQEAIKLGLFSDKS